jgi:uncharacterized SAM-binding protein YcdF (DUF218 family)
MWSLLLRRTSTRDYVLRVREAAQRRGWRRLLLVTSPYHGRRADLTFRRNAPELTVLHATPSESGYYTHRWEITPKQLRGLWHELLAIVYYWMKGWI